MKFLILLIGLSVPFVWSGEPAKNKNNFDEILNTSIAMALWKNGKVIEPLIGNIEGMGFDVIFLDKEKDSVWLVCVLENTNKNFKYNAYRVVNGEVLASHGTHINLKEIREVIRKKKVLPQKSSKNLKK
jgi:hypothetical protein